ncbi:P4 family phage/plasmid primase, partial [Candidatus Thiomargarita nelsonii]
RKLNENLVKQLTGDAILKARYMRQNFFEFRQEHKIWLATNHLPRVTGNDFAIWRRLPVIRFEVTIPESEKDKQLPQKLAAELPGILTWTVKGCLAWQRDGLQLPASVVNATEEYRADQDVLSAFFEDCCVIVPGVQVKTGELYKAYVEWCEANGEKSIENNRIFGKQLSERGFKPHRSHGVRYWQGIGLITVQTEVN